MSGVVGASMDHLDHEAAKRTVRVADPGAGHDAGHDAGPDVESVLQLAIDLHGPALLHQPDRLRNLLEEQCPQAGSDIALLLAALEARVPQTLLGASSRAEVERLVPQLEDRLCDERGQNPFGARWAVSLWHRVLRMDSAVLAVAPPASTMADAKAASASTPAIAPVAAPVVPAATLAIVPSRSTPSPEAAAPLVAAAVPVVKPAVPAAVIPAPAPSRPASSPLPSWAVPAPAVRPPAAIERTEPDRKPFPHWLGVVGVLVASTIMIGAIRFMSSQAPAGAPQAVPRAASPPAPAAIATQPAAPEPAAIVAPAATVAPPATRIADVASDATSDAALDGDGVEHPLFLTLEGPRDDVRWVEVLYLRGDGPWESRPRVIDVKPGDAKAGRIPLGKLGLRTKQPASATFQYTLAMADGRHSEPFVKTFTFAPVPARPASLVAIVAPSTIVAGEPFTLSLEFQRGETPLATVERREIEPGDATRSMAVGALTSAKADVLRYPVDAVASPARTIYEFTLIDRDGVRSPSRRVELNVLPRTEATKLAAPVAACRPETCGNVVSVHELGTREKTQAGRGGDPQRERTYEVIVRLDDRSIRTLTLLDPWKIGARVRMAGNRLVDSDSGRTSSQPGRLVPESAPIVDQ